MTRLLRLPKSGAGVTAYEVAKMERNKYKKVPPCKKRFCSFCQLNCKGIEALLDNINSRTHKTCLENMKTRSRCVTCNKAFETHSHLHRHLYGTVSQKDSIKQYK